MRLAPRILLAFFFLMPVVPAFARTCESLTDLHTATMAVTAAQPVSAGTFEKYDGLPGFCRVAATLKPSADSEIKIEVWLPEQARWNGRLESAGNGGWGGSINDGDLASGLRRGYATASTDTGHSGGGASFATGHPEKLVDFGYRAIHEMTVAAKTIIAAYYGGGLKMAVFSGCSSGGRQALMEAQRYPEDYDGIIAGAPTNNWTNLMFGRIWVGQATLSDEASYIPPTQYPLIHRAVLEACDALDGVKDGVLEDPTKCHFDPGVLACKGAASEACLTQPQVEAARRIYTPATNPVTKQEIFPPMERGSELDWKTLAGGPGPIGLADEYFKYVIFENPQWDFRTLNFTTDMARAQKKDGGVLTANNADLRRFFAHGGKLIEYQGWADRQVMPRNSIHYRAAVEAAVGKAEADGSYRLFLAPGMDHCGGGDGPNTFDMLTAMEDWKLKNVAPESILASHSTDGKVDRTRPLCAYPRTAHYKGSGSTDDAANFTCSVR